MRLKTTVYIHSDKMLIESKILKFEQQRLIGFSHCSSEISNSKIFSLQYHFFRILQPKLVYYSSENLLNMLMRSLNCLALKANSFGDPNASTEFRKECGRPSRIIAHNRSEPKDGMELFTGREASE